jgi:hypothetical protein
MIQIYTLAHKRPDFIEMQYNSMKKNLKGDFEYIVINNAIDSELQSRQIDEICKSLNIKCIPVELCQDLNNGSFAGNSYTNVNLACYYPMTWLFQRKLENVTNFCFIDSDVFFMNEIDLNDILINNDSVFMPQYRGSFLYMAPTLLCMDLQKVKNYKSIDWNYYREGAIDTDIGGKSGFFLRENQHIKNKYIEQYTIYDTEVAGDISTIHIIINGNINYEIKENIKTNSLISVRHIGGNSPVSGFKSFNYQPDYENYSEKIYLGYLNVKKYVYDKDLPKPAHLGFMRLLGEDDFFAVHYQVGSNYADFSNDEYNSKKTEAVKKII